MTAGKIEQVKALMLEGVLSINVRIRYNFLSISNIMKRYGRYR